MIHRQHRQVDFQAQRLAFVAAVGRTEVDVDLAPIHDHRHHRHDHYQTLDCAHLGQLVDADLVPLGVGQRDDQVLDAIAIQIGRQDESRGPGQGDTHPAHLQRFARGARRST